MIRFSHVDKVFEGGFEALNDVCLMIGKGEFVFLSGASGAGKTTLLKHVYMEELPTSGQVLVSRYDSKYMRKRDIPMLRREIGVVFQDFRLLPDRDVFENVALTLRVTGLPERKVKHRVFEVLAQTGLSHKCSYYPAQLSGGEQQRVSIARAIANDPWVLLADEPTGNLDMEVAKGVFDLLQRINSWGTTVVMATHDLYFIETYPYRHIVLDHGQVVRDSATKGRPQSWRVPA
ncbi:MAG: cell division ATP-binding protein FtsE [Chitinivibrionales bacterium]|nr:cell division ATP-binding protein FtsE [Chitinivibrionales bacterium]